PVRARRRRCPRPPPAVPPPGRRRRRCRSRSLWSASARSWHPRVPFKGDALAGHATGVADIAATGAGVAHVGPAGRAVGVGAAGGGMEEAPDRTSDGQTTRSPAFERPRLGLRIERAEAAPAGRPFFEQTDRADERLSLV